MYNYCHGYWMVSRERGESVINMNCRGMTIQETAEALTTQIWLSFVCTRSTSKQKRSINN